jgi:hypothetical protein
MRSPKYKTTSPDSLVSTKVSCLSNFDCRLTCLSMSEAATPFVIDLTMSEGTAPFVIGETGHVCGGNAPGQWYH